MASDPISSFARTTLNLSSAGFGGLLYGNRPGDAIWRNFLLGVGEIVLPVTGAGALVAGSYAISGNDAPEPAVGDGALIAAATALAGVGASSSTGRSETLDIANATGAKQQVTFGATSPLGAVGQSFTAIGNAIISVTPWVAKAGAPIDSMVLKLYAATGDLPNTGVLLGTAPAVLGSSLAAGTAAPLEFFFPTPVPVVIGTKYVYTLERTGVADSGGFYVVGYFNAPNYADGSFVQRSSGTWATYPFEMAFTIRHLKSLQAGGSVLAGTDQVADNLVQLSPDADIAADGWTSQSGGTSDIWQGLAAVSDLDYVQSPALADASTDLVVRLYEGTTLVQQWTHNDVGDAFADAVQPVTGSIGDFSNLFVEMDDTNGNVYRFSLGNPSSGSLSSPEIRYRYKKLAGT